MSAPELTAREREYLDCETPMISAGTAAARLITGVFVSLLQAAFTPGNGKADRGLFRTVREIGYTKYKKAVLRKQIGELTKKDERLLVKLNKKPFVLDEDTFDADKYTQELYEEYMRAHRNE